MINFSQRTKHQFRGWPIFLILDGRSFANTQEIAARLGKTAGAVRQSIDSTSRLLGIDLRKSAADQYSSPPVADITQEVWQRLKPRHFAIAWTSLSNPTWGSTRIARELGIKKSSDKAAVKYVKEIRREASHILGVPIRTVKTT